MTVKTSVITLSYNRADWLAEAIASIENQTHQDYEHLVYDNGSKDPRVLDVLRAAKDRRPDKFFYAAPGFPPRDIVGPHWNILMGLSRGKYITILDDDNRKRPEFLDKMTMPLDCNRSLAAVSCGWQPIDSAGNERGPARHYNLNTSMTNLWRDNTIDSNAVLFRRSVLDQIGQFAGLTTNEDWHFIIRLVKHCQVEHLEDVLVDYREHGTARSRRALELGAHANWDAIRRELFTDTDEQRRR